MQIPAYETTRALNLKTVKAEQAAESFKRTEATKVEIPTPEPSPKIGVNLNKKA